MFCFANDQENNGGVPFFFGASFFLFISHHLKKVTRLGLTLCQYVYEKKTNLKQTDKCSFVPDSAVFR